MGKRSTSQNIHHRVNGVRLEPFFCFLTPETRKRPTHGDLALFVSGVFVLALPTPPVSIIPLPDKEITPREDHKKCLQT